MVGAGVGAMVSRGVVRGSGARKNKECIKLHEHL